MEGSLEPGLLLFGHHWFLLVLIAFVSVCASLYPCRSFPAQPTLLPRRRRQLVCLKCICLCTYTVSHPRRLTLVSVNQFIPAWTKLKSKL